MFFLVPKLVGYFNYSNTWLEQEDNIALVEFKQKPKIYFIQVDGYANFSVLKKEPYNFDNSDFEVFLEANDFKFYDSFRSNYYSTLSSNSSMFAMKHHCYFKPKDVFAEITIKQTHETLVKSIYSSVMAIKWPENKAPYFDDNIKSSVNIFRILFSYLSENEDYLNYL